MDNLRSGVLLIAAGVGLGIFWWSGAAGAVIGDLVAGIRSGRQPAPPTPSVAGAASPPATTSPLPRLRAPATGVI